MKDKAFKHLLCLIVLLFCISAVFKFLPLKPWTVDIQAISKSMRDSPVAEPVKPHSDSQSLEVINLERRAYIRKFCQRNGKINETVDSKLLANTIVCEKYNVLFCYIPKIGCSQWKSVMLNASASSPKYWLHARKNFKFLADYPTDIANRMLQTYFKFLFVREPFERFLSAYIDKLYHRKPDFMSRYAKKIKKPLAKGVNVMDQNITFDEFVNYVLNIGGGHWDEHWQTYDKLCHPCAVDYDFVGRFENLEVEASYALRVSGINKNGTVVVFPETKPSTTASKIPFYFSQLSKKALNSLIQLYRGDSEMFGYNFPFWLL